MDAEKKYVAWQTAQGTTGCREFLLNTPGLYELIRDNMKYLLTGDTLVVGCQRTVRHNVGFGLQARLVVSTQGGKCFELGCFFMPGFPDGFPMGYFSEELFLPVDLGPLDEEDMSMNNVCLVYRPHLTELICDGEGGGWSDTLRPGGLYLHMPNRY